VQLYIHIACGVITVWGLIRSFVFTSGCPWPKATVKSPVGALALPDRALPCLAARSPKPRFLEPPAQPCPDPCPLPEPARPLPRPALSSRPFSVRTGSRFWNSTVRAGSRSRNPTVRVSSAASIKMRNRCRTHRQTHTHVPPPLSPPLAHIVLP
jgi:hypothetical protein